MAKQKTSRIKRAEERIVALVHEFQRLAQHVNLIMNTINEYIMFKGDLEGFEEHIKSSTNDKKEENEKKLAKKEDK